MTARSLPLIHRQNNPRSVDARPELLIARHYLSELLRNRFVRWLLISFTALVACSLLFGALQTSHLARHHEAATQQDWQVWTTQGAKDPHSAAHFGQYAFKPYSALTVAEPGVERFLGSTIWLEAHKQNDAQFSASRDLNSVNRMGDLTLAWLVQVIFPLLIIIMAFAAIAGERESGTLRLLLSLGVRPAQVIWGKSLAISWIVLASLMTATIIMAVFIVAGLGNSSVSIMEQLIRLALMMSSYLMYLAGFIALTVAVSALAKKSAHALTILIAFWLLNSFVAPRFASEIAAQQVPLPTAQAMREAIAKDKAVSFGHSETHPAFIAFREDILKKYKVSNVKDLPVNFRGLTLRKDDENGYVVFDKHFSHLQQMIAHQDRWQMLGAAVFPLLAMNSVSMGFAGTDSAHQFAFAQAAEQHRRVLQTKASEDLINNGIYQGEYKADPKLWQQMQAFDYKTPPLATLLHVQLAGVLWLLAWLLITVLWARLVAHRLKVD